MTPKGRWIRTTTAWHERDLDEGRLPNAAELDAATRDHPVLVKRMGHTDAVNSMALQLAGITRSTEDPPGGFIERDRDGNPTGILRELPAMNRVERLLPVPSAAEQVAALRDAAAVYAGEGFTTVRDALVLPDEFAALREACSGGLAVRVRTLHFVASGRSVSEACADIDSWGIVSGRPGLASASLCGIRSYSTSARTSRSTGDTPAHRTRCRCVSGAQEGVLLAAGDDYPAGNVAGAGGIWGLTTRQTAQGVLGASHAVDRATAIELYTRVGGQLLSETGLGVLKAGGHADLTVFPADPYTCPLEDLRHLRPVLTVMAGRPVYDPEGLAASSQGAS